MYGNTTISRSGSKGSVFLVVSDSSFLKNFGIVTIRFSIENSYKDLEFSGLEKPNRMKV